MTALLYDEIGENMAHRKTTRPSGIRTNLDEIASLLAQGYLRLQQKRAGMYTSSQHSPDEKEISLDLIAQAERSLVCNESLNEEDNND